MCPLDAHDWMLVALFSLPVLLLDEARVPPHLETLGAIGPKKSQGSGSLGQDFGGFLKGLEGLGPVGFNRGFGTEIRDPGSVEHPKVLKFFSRQQRTSN